MCCIHRMCHAKSPMALFSVFMYIMQGTFAIPECEIKIWLIFRCSRRPLTNVNKQGEQRCGTYGVTDPVQIDHSIAYKYCSLPRLRDFFLILHLDFSKSQHWEFQCYQFLPFSTYIEIKPHQAFAVRVKHTSRTSQHHVADWSHFITYSFIALSGVQLGCPQMSCISYQC